jgi:selenocysteine lyase/cysteine desulfurase
MDELRSAFGRLIGADPSSVTLTDNTCRSANIAIGILAARPGSNVIVDDGTYPSSVYPWRAHENREVRLVHTDGVADAASLIAEQVDDETTAVCITHVAPFTGRRHDLRALSAVCHEHGALLMVDAAQTTGVVPIDVVAEGIDLLVTTGMKWLLGLPGVGYLYVAPEVLREAPVLDVGYLGLDTPLGDWPVGELPGILADARRYELGLPSLPALAACTAGIELLLEVGIDRIFAQSERLTTRAIEGLAERGRTITTPTDPAQRAGVIALPSDDPAAEFERCRRAGVDIGTLIGGLRIDPHGYNDDEDIDRLLACF